MPVVNKRALIDNRFNAIREYHEQCGVKRAELDVSGGVDSAVVLGLLAGALGPKNITAVYQGINSNPKSLERAREVANTFGVTLIEIDLTDIFDQLQQSMRKAILEAHSLGPERTGSYECASKALDERISSDPLILGSLRSCIRAPIGRGFNRMMGGGIRHGTGNECEDRWTRFYQKGGDGEVDTNPIAMLSKGEVYQLALGLGVPKEIIIATPSPDLWGEGDGHNDEDEYSTYFGFKLEGHTFYSYVDVETGEYTRVGLIERVSRFLDEVGEGIFRDNHVDNIDFLGGTNVAAFNGSGLSSDQIRMVLSAASRIERATRHKFNPNCPTLGSRSDLVGARILTNNLNI